MSRCIQRTKARLCSAHILAMPDFKQPFILDTDASNFAIGSVLSQRIDGKERPIAYASRTLTKAERQYCVTRMNCLQLYTSVNTLSITSMGNSLQCALTTALCAGF